MLQHPILNVKKQRGRKIRIDSKKKKIGSNLKNHFESTAISETLAHIISFDNQLELSRII